MITFGMKTSFKDAIVGDEFCIIEYGQWSSSPISVINYKVEKVGKRDIKCVAKNGFEITVSKKYTHRNPVAYECGGKEAKEAIALIILTKRQKNCAAIVKSRSSGSEFDSELMDAIEAFEKRINENSETKKVL